MNIAILGYGVEGKSIERFFNSDNITIFDHFRPEEVPSLPLSDFDLVFRSPSVRPPLEFLKNPPKNWTSSTNYFFTHCPCPIIGVTGTKGKGTTCSLIAALLNGLNYNTHLVGNIGTPALDALNYIKNSDVVIYEMSSFQLWDLQKSPHIAVVLRIEPDHLDVHYDFDDYRNAKSNIIRHQSPDDTCIFYGHNPNSLKIASLSPAKNQLPYPYFDLISLPKSQRNDTISLLYHTLDNLSIKGAHNQENAVAALTAVSAFLSLPLFDFIKKYNDIITQVFKDFQGLPHRIEYIRTLENIDFYDDNYSSAFPALDVAISAFIDRPVFLIAGGKDRHLDLTKTIHRLNSAQNLTKIFLIGETNHALAAGLPSVKFELHDTLPDAVTAAFTAAKALLQKDPSSTTPVVLMSPGAASFDMFKNFSDRGEKFQKIVKDL